MQLMSDLQRRRLSTWSDLSALRGEQVLQCCREPDDLKDSLEISYHFSEGSSCESPKILELEVRASAIQVLHGGSMNEGQCDTSGATSVKDLVAAPRI